MTQAVLGGQYNFQRLVNPAQELEELEHWRIVTHSLSCRGAIVPLVFPCTGAQTSGLMAID